jgi:hypothetical protein
MGPSVIAKSRQEIATKRARSCATIKKLCRDRQRK